MPAPSRHLVVRSGSTYAAVSAATEFSDWMQIPDREAPGRVGFGFDESPTVGTEKMLLDYGESMADSPVPEEGYPGDIAGLANDLAGPFAGMGAHSGSEYEVNHSPWEMISGTYPGDDDAFYFVHVRNGSRGAGHVATCVDLDAGRWRDAWVDSWPLGAIGYEVEVGEPTPGTWGPYSKAVRANAVATVAPSVHSGSHLSGLVARLVVNDHWGDGTLRIESSITAGAQWQASGQPTPYVIDEETYFAAEVPVPNTGTLTPAETFNFEVPMTGANEWSGAFGAFYSICKSQWSPSVVDVRVSGEGDGQMLASPNVNMAVTYTIRPPRIRWIYAAPQAVSYRRVYPRDDGLAGGAPRTWPPSKAVQSSNRTFGGYL